MLSELALILPNTDKNTDGIWAAETSPPVVQILLITLHRYLRLTSAKREAGCPEKATLCCSQMKHVGKKKSRKVLKPLSQWSKAPECDCKRENGVVVFCSFELGLSLNKAEVILQGLVMRILP